ncbi:hypothetical protein GH714_014886 [Hevea brasiliensis]|uniref:Reverse transcriptase Ty1/copia-type domain-containing protein n=1 Tax=Hevea brasiliensis TaxID=3981 RepID=A0A6A6N416_HEVBR|nr:hypothetical protein GH714_014886 [Hevea brasiliensis]
MKGTKYVAQYPGEIRSFADELSLVGSSLGQAELIIKILSGLSPEFKEISAAICARDHPITYKELYDKLSAHENFLTHEALKKDAQTISVHHTQHGQQNSNSNRSFNGNNATFNNNRKNGGTNGGFSQNYNPHQYSQHNNRNFNVNSGWRNANNWSSQRVQCQLCDKYGHVAKVCRSCSHNALEAQANFTSRQTSPAPSWIMDTGASHHVTQNIQNLQAYSEYAGSDDIIIGDDGGGEYDGLHHILVQHDLWLDPQDTTVTTDVVQYSPPPPVDALSNVPTVPPVISNPSQDELSSLSQSQLGPPQHVSAPPFTSHEFTLALNVSPPATSSTEDVCQALSSRFSLKDLQPITYFLGIEVCNTDLGLTLTQTKYIIDLPQEFGMMESKSATTPLSSTTVLKLDDGSVATDATQYQRLLGALSPVIKCDNLGATYTTQNPVYHSRIKHVALDFHFIRDQVRDGSLIVEHVPSTMQLADTLTKIVPTKQFRDHLPKLGVQNFPPNLRRRIKEE